MNEKENQFTVS